MLTLTDADASLLVALTVEFLSGEVSSIFYIHEQEFNRMITKSCS
jgi:hypothetical protein